ncbi:hypothetical protein [Aliiglaciecola litoralis]|uniref:Uncharacterized protein n=1 Tax=Aliiglaciecola litoralis TaxID=582857 RepID=A0ABP3WWE0_9ALTE
MKPNHIAKAAIVSLFIASTLFGTSALAGSKQKPPAAETTTEVVWYQSVLDFFNF